MVILDKLDSKELSKYLFHSILHDLSGKTEELGEFEAKELVYSALKNYPGIEVEWGQTKPFGKTTMVLKIDSRYIVWDLAGFVVGLRLVWNTYVRSLNGKKKNR